MGKTGWIVAGTSPVSAAGAVAVAVAMAGMTMHHRPQEGSLRPVMATRPCFITRKVVLRKVMVQSLSMRVPTDIRDPDIRYGRMCDRRVYIGRLVRGVISSWVDFNEVPSGRRMLMGCIVGQMSVMGQRIMT